MLVVHHVFRPDTSLQILEVGSLLPLHATALGKAVLAYLDDEVRRDLVGSTPTKLTGQTLVTAAALSRDSNLVRSAAYALEKEEGGARARRCGRADLRPPLGGGRRDRRRRATGACLHPRAATRNSAQR